MDRQSTDSVDRNTAKGGSGQAKSGSITATDTVQKIRDGVTYAIRSGQMVPGQHLVEADLTGRFGVSRGSLREGLRQLASEGMVTLTPYRGAFIAAMDRNGIRDLLDVLQPLCELAADRAAKTEVNESELNELLTIAREISDPHGPLGRAKYLEKRHDFYDLLIKLGGNSELRRVIPLARTDLFRAQFDRAQTSSQHHLHSQGYLKIAQAVASRKPAAARKAVVEHFIGTRKTLEELPESAFSYVAR